MKLQILRRLVQVATILSIVLIALLSLYAHYRAARVIDDPQLMAGLRGEVTTTLIHPIVDKLNNPEAFLDGYKGTVWSMRLAGVDLSDPLAAAEAIAATKHVHWPLIVSIIVPIVLTVLFGKVFCSWICPAYVLFEISGKLRRLLRFAEITPGEVKFAHANKYIFLVVGLAIAAATSAPLFALIYPPAVLSRVVHAWIFGTALTGMVVLLLVIIAFEVLVSPRWWCQTMCPGGALYGLLGYFRPVRVKLKEEACTGCQKCIPVCEAGINPITQSESIECDNCGVCLRHCGDNALVFSIGLPVRNEKRRSQHSAPLARAAMLGVAVAVLLLPVEAARGHHILGLPHYSYKENYPQRPTLEYPATTGPYEVLLTSYPGIPTPGEPANLAIYIKNKETNRVYNEMISVRVLQTSTFGDNRVIVPPTKRTPFDNEYKYHVTLPVAGEYIVELSMPVEGRTEVIPFLIVVGDPTSTASFVIVGSIGVVVLFVALRAVQKKRQRRRANAKARSLTVCAGATS